jgi:hypothetical protein
MPRRRLLALAWLGAATASANAEPPARLSQAAAQYQDHPRGGLSCVGCSFFRPPRSCQVVAGDISPNGWCRLFALPD